MHPALCREIFVDVTDGRFQKKTQERVGVMERDDEEEGVMRGDGGISGSHSDWFFFVFIQ